MPKASRDRSLGTLAENKPMPIAPHSAMIWLIPLFLIGCGRPGDGRERGSDKREWSILQSLEEAHRGDVIAGPEVRRAEEYMIICVPDQASGTRIWIMADPKSPPFYKQMPSGNYFLTKEQIAEITRQANPTTTVLEALNSHKK
jgi:hypothetical protein